MIHLIRRFLKNNIQRKAIVLVDYENISKNATEQLKTVNLNGIINLCVEKFGIVKVAFAFFPLHYLTESLLSMLDSAGFSGIPCPTQKIDGKEKDRVDSRLISLAKVFDEHSDITDAVIVSNDGDFSPLINFFKHRGIKVTVLGIGKISQALVGIADDVLEIPTTK